jgi:hypothetical protein
LYSISLQWGSKNLGSANPEETGFKKLVSCNMKLQLRETGALSFKQLKSHKIAQPQFHSSSPDGSKQRHFTVNQAAHTVHHHA